MTSREHLTRMMWTLFEPIHALNYFSPEARSAFADVGIPRFWDGYFAGRSAPLGAVTAAPVVAMFSGFNPALVERSLPSAWASATPDVVLEARLAGAEGALRRILGAASITEPHVADAAAALSAAAMRIDAAATIGRPLAAANAALPMPTNPYRRLWQATSTLREHRGDGHVLALAAGDIAGLSTIVLRSAVDLDATVMKGTRGWSDETWAVERARLEARGLLGSDGTITAPGTAALRDAEELTNRLAVSPWQSMSETDIAALARLLLPLSHACAVTYPQPNPIGMPMPWDPDAQ